MWLLRTCTFWSLPVCPALPHYLVHYAPASLILILLLCKFLSPPQGLLAHMVFLLKACFGVVPFHVLWDVLSAPPPTPRPGYFPLLSTFLTPCTFLCNTCENCNSLLAELFLNCVCLAYLSLPDCKFLKGKDKSFLSAVVFPAISWGHQIFAERNHLRSLRQMINW